METLLSKVTTDWRYFALMLGICFLIYAIRYGLYFRSIRQYCDPSNRQKKEEGGNNAHF
ncbi:MAG: hypothetical protein PHC97_01995 [Patescibacteria group bacterium]|nr:hypothetical protein [Patescibacteria group bacterium]